MENNLTVGKIGEEIACKYLAGNGFKVVERNFRRPWGELDIIARARDGALVFIEVKAMKFNESGAWQRGESGKKFNGPAGILPEDNMTLSKLRKTRKIAAMYANENPGLVDEAVGWRIDLIAISIFGSPNSPLTDLIKNCEIKHFENVE